ncbi:hypothetical protein BDV98DRAFT_335364 [Pterulicium gracile]|uniref:Protein kinase domain-containing protein n=1 Tax=Pterulicium gracile TaxID=1884261 RepID=A0A5C3Q2E4_9AGAR|nr:hypothetical protein BDV98DRAFT_335364 [Pterula gracilis]
MAFVRRCIRVDPNHRPVAAELLQDEFWSDVDALASQSCPRIKSLTYMYHHQIGFTLAYSYRDVIGHAQCPELKRTIARTKKY